MGTRSRYFSIFILLFFLLCALPGIGMFFQGKVQPIGNEILSPVPRLFRQDGKFNTNILNEFSDYYEDHFAFRRQLATAWAQLNAGCFRSSAEDQVMLGRDDWLFYTETARDCMGLGLTDRQICAAARNLALMQEYLSEENIRFCFVIAPNKGSLYSEYLPEYVKPDHARSNAARLLKIMTAENIAAADLFQAFADREILYYRADSHWTDQGAALACDTILPILGRSSDFYALAYTPDGRHKGDLFEMLYPSSEATEPKLRAEYDFSFVCDKDPAGGNAITISAENPTATGSLYCWRDSFGNALYPFLAEAFQHSVFSRSSRYDLFLPVKQGCEYVVIELVERNLSRLLTQPAVFPAPERRMPAVSYDNTLVYYASEQTAGKNSDQWVRYYGDIDLLPVDKDSQLLIQAGERVYEASLTLNEEGTMGFSLWLPNFVTEIDAIIYKNGSNHYLCSAEKENV